MSAAALQPPLDPTHMTPRGPPGARGGAGGSRDLSAIPLSLALERALLHYRHPASRLPPALLKMLGAPSLGASERDYAEALNDQWDASLRALFAALRDGRLPYFYCRAEPPNAKEPTAAAHGSFTVLWRNTALPLDTDDESGAAGSLPLGWAASDEASCYAVLSPSTRGLRSALTSRGVPFEMPLAPPSMREGAAGAGAHASSSAGGSTRHGGDAGLDTPGRDAATLADLNRGRPAEIQPDTEAGIQHALATLDHKTGSTLVVHGARNCHALHEFLMNHRPSPHPYFLTLQLLAPLPFVNGAPHTPRVVYASGRQRGFGAASADGGGASASSTDDIIHLEDAEKGGGALMLPTALRRLVTLLRRTQPCGFEMVVQPDAGGASSDALNAKPATHVVTPADLLLLVPSSRPQPGARLMFPVEATPGAAEAEPPAFDVPMRESEASRKRSISQVYYRDGELRLM